MGTLVIKLNLLNSLDHSVLLRFYALSSRFNGMLSQTTVLIKGTLHIFYVS